MLVTAMKISNLTKGFSFNKELSHNTWTDQASRWLLVSQIVSGKSQLARNKRGHMIQHEKKYFDREHIPA
jgi:hypothetical protein